MSREAFERIYCGGNARIIRRNEHGDYVSPVIQDAWAGWQAARAAALEEAAKEADHWQQINGAGHRCGEYIAGAIRALKEKE